MLASEVGTEPERLRCLLYLLARGDYQEPAKAVVTIGVGLIVSDERENAFRLAHRKYVAPHGRFAIGVLTGSASELTCLALPKGKAFDKWTFKYSTRETHEANARWAFSKRGPGGPNSRGEACARFGGYSLGRIESIRRETRP